MEIVLKFHENYFTQYFFYLKLFNLLNFNFSLHHLNLFYKETPFSNQNTVNPRYDKSRESSD